MTVRSKAYLEALFVTNHIVTQSDMTDLIDSYADWFNAKVGNLATRYEPITYADEVVIFNHDVLMMEVAN